MAIAHKTHTNPSCSRLIAPSNGTKTWTNNSVIHTKTGPRDDLSCSLRQQGGARLPPRVPSGSTAEAASRGVLFVGNQRASWRPHACHELEASTIRHAPISSGTRMCRSSRGSIGCRRLDRSTAPRGGSSAGCCSAAAAAPAPSSRRQAAWTPSPSPRRPRSAAAGNPRCRTGCRPCTSTRARAPINNQNDGYSQIYHFW